MRSRLCGQPVARSKRADRPLQLHRFWVEEQCSGGREGLIQGEQWTLESEAMNSNISIRAITRLKSMKVASLSCSALTAGWAMFVHSGTLYCGRLRIRAYETFPFWM